LQTARILSQKSRLANRIAVAGIAIILFIQGTLLQLFTHNSKDSAPHDFRSLTPNETIIDPLNNTVIDPLHQLLSKYDIPVSALDCDGGKEEVS
jgi:hypothetical protein